MNTLLFYTNNNSLYDYLSKNYIACEAILPNRRGDTTLGTISPSCLFLTHKKLNRENRAKGINDVTGGTYPISLAFDFSGFMVPAVLVSIEPETNKKAFSVGAVEEYDEKLHIGAFVFAELPLSGVSKIYFDNPDEQEWFNRATPDSWYPTDLYGIFDSDEACDVIEFSDEDFTALESLLAENKISEAVEDSKKRNKKRAALFNYCVSSQKLIIGKYALPIDKQLQNIFEITDDELSTALNGKIVEKLSKVQTDSQPLSLFTNAENLNFSQELFNRIFDMFMNQNAKQRFIPSDFKPLFDNICDGITDDEHRLFVQNIFSEIIKIANFDSEIQINELTSFIEKACPELAFLGSLVYVVLNSSEYPLFLDSLCDSKADCQTYRYASLFMGALKGLGGYPGVGYQKDNRVLWKNVEWKVSTDGNPMLFSLQRPENLVCETELLGLPAFVERVITDDELYEFFLSNEKACESMAKTICTIAKGIRRLKYSDDKYKGYNFKKKIVSILDSIKDMENVTKAEKTELEKALKYCTETINIDAVINDFIRPKDTFMLILAQRRDDFVAKYKQLNKER